VFELAALSIYIYIHIDIKPNGRVIESKIKLKGMRSDRGLLKFIIPELTWIEDTRNNNNNNSTKILKTEREIKCRLPTL
jgi:hypothetical protein